MDLTFFESHEFAKTRDKLFSNDEEFRWFEDGLMQNPKVGKVIPGTNSVRKTRWGSKAQGKGKRGGVRIFYLFVEEESRIYLLAGFRKNELENPTGLELKRINESASRERT